MVKTSDVFGISRNLPLNYIERKNVDNRFVENLARDKHLVIFGSSKQGKTSLRKHALNADDYIVVHCLDRWTISDINSAILKRVGFEISQSTSKTISGKLKIYARIKASIFGSGVQGDAKTEDEKILTTIKTPLELDPEDVNDIIHALQSIDFDKYIILEDFHYLPLETQKDFSVSLKAFHEESKYCFIIIGVWLEENRLTIYNGDLTGRLISIDTDTWTTEELKKVISLGEEKLNIKFSEDFIHELMINCFNSVYIVQESCRQCCLSNNIHSKMEEKKEIGTKKEAEEIVTSVVNQQSGRFNSFLTQFADGFQSTELEMYKWILYSILTANIRSLKEGLRLNDITKKYKQNIQKGKNSILGISHKPYNQLQRCS